MIEYYYYCISQPNDNVRIYDNDYPMNDTTIVIADNGEL